MFMESVAHHCTLYRTIFWKCSLFCIKAAKYGRILGDGKNAQLKYALFVIKQLLINNNLEINSGITTLIWICKLKIMANSEAGSKTVRYTFLNYQLMGDPGWGVNINEVSMWMGGWKEGTGRLRAIGRFGWLEGAMTWLDDASSALCQHAYSDDFLYLYQRTKGVETTLFYFSPK